MSIEPRGASALDRLRARYDRESRTCPECGYEDDPGSWRVETTGGRVYYRHLCPSCGGRLAETTVADCCGGTGSVYDTPGQEVLACEECEAVVYEF
ncbi:HVO_0649 family zinc finger protein [Halobium palmae]|uniref:HVO_0649 family zinc finger protein n=1 Tax=Halobium palmae TaxID=1776492 RepID=A0ABD5S554_9EURY